VSTSPAHSPGHERRPRLPAAFRALEHRNYRLFFAGQIVSLSGTWMQSVAQSWLVYRLTGSPALLGLVGFASQIPVFLLAPLGGMVADRHQRRNVLLVTQSTAMVLALTLGVLTVSGVIEVWHVFVLAALLGSVNAFYVPTQAAFVVDMVGKQDLMNAIALNSSMMNGARIVGPAIAGLLVAGIGEGWCFIVNGATYVAVLTSLGMMRMPKHTAAPLQVSPLAHIIEGFRFAAHNGPVRKLLLTLGLVSLFGMPYMVLMPIFADRILHGGPEGLGILMGAAGLGALAGALTLAMRRQLKGLSVWVASATSAFGVAIIGFAYSRSFWLSAALLVPTGFSMMLQMAGSNTLVQAMVPDHLRGRVMAVYSMMFMGMAPLGALLAGSLADRIGSPATVALGGVVCIAAGAVFIRGLPRFRNEAREMIVSMEMAGGDPAEETTAQASLSGQARE